jgi:hypothetical protein
MESRDFESAIRAFGASIAMDPHFKSLELLGECLLIVGRPIEAIVPLAASATLNPGIRARSLLARAFLECRDYRRATEFATRVLAAAPGNRLAKQVLEESSHAKA